MKNRYNEILTLPNILTVYRLLLAPILYLTITEGMQGLSLFVFLLSGVSDLADGFLARRLGEVSSLGKILDPIADKLTYALALLALIPRVPLLGILLVLLLIKEGVSTITSLIAIGRNSHIQGARIHGKITGLVLWTTVFLHLLPLSLPKVITIVTLCLSLTAMTFSFALYLREHLSKIPQNERSIVEDFMSRL